MKKIILLGMVIILLSSFVFGNLIPGRMTTSQPLKLSDGTIIEYFENGHIKVEGEGLCYDICKEKELSPTFSKEFNQELNKIWHPTFLGNDECICYNCSLIAEDSDSKTYEKEYLEKCDPKNVNFEMVIKSIKGDQLSLYDYSFEYPGVNCGPGECYLENEKLCYLEGTILNNKICSREYNNNLDSLEWNSINRDSIQLNIRSFLIGKQGAWFECNSNTEKLLVNSKNKVYECKNNVWKEKLIEFQIPEGITVGLPGKIDPTGPTKPIPLFCPAPQIKTTTQWLGPHGIYFTREACCPGPNMCTGPIGDTNCYSPGHTWELSSFPGYFNEQISWKCNNEGNWQVWTPSAGYYCLRTIEVIEKEKEFSFPIIGGDIKQIAIKPITPPNQDNNFNVGPIGPILPIGAEEINVDPIHPEVPRISIKYTCPTGATCNMNTMQCMETSCTDGKDNSGNGLIDCEDPNCNYRVCGRNKICYKGRCTEESKPDIFYYTERKIVHKTFEDVFKDIIESAQLFKNIQEDCRSFCNKRGMYSAFGKGLGDRCTCITNE